jgi:hypothetical protein
MTLIKNINNAKFSAEDVQRIKTLQSALQKRLRHSSLKFKEFFDVYELQNPDQIRFALCKSAPDVKAIGVILLIESSSQGAKIRLKRNHKTPKENWTPLSKNLSSGQFMAYLDLVFEKYQEVMRFQGHKLSRKK